MANEMENVPGSISHGSLQVSPGLPFQPAQLHQAFFLEVLDGSFHPLPLTIDLQGGQVTRAGDHTEDAQWWCHGQ